MAKPCTPHLIAQRVQLFEIETANVKRLSFGRATPVFFLGKENGRRIMCSARGAAIPAALWAAKTNRAARGH